MNSYNDNQTPYGPNSPLPQFSFIRRVIHRLAGVDNDTMRQCPQHDADNVRALGELLIASFIWQSLLLTLIGERLFAEPGQFRPDILAGATGIALFVMLIDSYIFYRSGFELAGIEELRRASLDVGGPGPGKKVAYLIARIFLSIGFSQLTAIFTALLISGADIDARLLSTYQTANARSLTAVAGLVDADIQRTTSAVKTQEGRIEAVSSQVTTLRQHDIDPTANEPRLQQAQQEVSEALAAKTKAAEAAIAAETFASMEKGGVTVDGRSSGVAGIGPRYKAALETVDTAKRHAQETSSFLDDARARLEKMRKESASAASTQQERSHSELPTYEKSLTTEEGKLAKLKDQLSALVKDRPDNIRRGVEAAADYVPLNRGFLAQLVALDEIATENRKIGMVILLIDIVSFGLELAAVLAKVSSYVPMKYSALLAANSYAAAVRIADELVAKLANNAKTEVPSSSAPPVPPANDNDNESESNGEANDTSDEPDTLTDQDESPPALPKRGRGRPRKPRSLH
jgi:hypothetical protein